MKTYLGLTSPLDAVWSNGKNVTVYPDGKVVDKTDGRIIRNADIPTSNYNSEIEFSNSGSSNNLMVFAIIALVAIVAIVAVSKK